MAGQDTAPLGPDPPKPLPSRDQPEFSPGTVIGEYTLVKLLGRGGMGEVHEAQSSGRTARFALKILKPEVTPREGAILDYLDHPNVVVLHHQGTFTDPQHRTRHYLVLRLVRQACSISTYADSRKLGTPQCVRLFLDACRGVEAMHVFGTHLDLKPDNILVDVDGHVYVNDFGLARLVTDRSAELSGLTYAFASPEQIDTSVADLDRTSDVFSLGATLYELLVGREPHAIATGTPPREIKRAKHSPPRPLREFCPDADDALDRIILKALAPARHNRYSSVEKFREALEHWLATRSTVRARLRHQWSRRPVCRAACKALLVAAIGALIAGFALAPLVNRMLRWETSVALPDAPRSLEHVVLVPLPEDPRAIDSLAHGLGLLDVRATDRPTLRTLHAALCDRLAGVADTIVFDIGFPPPREGFAANPADPILAEAIRGAQVRQTAVVVGCQERTTDASDQPAIADLIWAAGPQWGCFSVFDSGDRAVIPLLTDHEGKTYPSLALAAVAATRTEGLYPQFELKQAERVIESRYWRKASRDGFRHWSDAVDRTAPAFLQEFDPSRTLPPHRGFIRGDVMACLLVRVPSAAIRDAATVPYEDLMSSDAALDRVRDAVVLVYDPGGDMKVPTREGMARGAHWHAAAIELLLTGRTLRHWGEWQHAPAMLLAGLLGAMLGWSTLTVALTLGGRWSRRHIAITYQVAALVRWTIVAAMVTGLHAGALWFCESTSILFSPVPTACTLLVAGEVGALVALLLDRSSPRKDPA